MLGVIRCIPIASFGTRQATCMQQQRDPLAPHGRSVCASVLVAVCVGMVVGVQASIGTLRPGQGRKAVKETTHGLA